MELKQFVPANEKIEFQTHAHPFIFSVPIGLILLSFVFIVLGGELRSLSGLTLIVGLILGAYCYHMYANSNIVLTDRRILAKQAFSNDIINVAFDQIATLENRHTAVGNAFRYGDLLISTRDGHRNTFRNILCADELLNRIQIHVVPLQTA